MDDLRAYTMITDWLQSLPGCSPCIERGQLRDFLKQHAGTPISPTLKDVLTPFDNPHTGCPDVGIENILRECATRAGAHLGRTLALTQLEEQIAGFLFLKPSNKDTLLLRLGSYFQGTYVDFEDEERVLRSALDELISNHLVTEKFDGKEAIFYWQEPLADLRIGCTYKHFKGGRYVVESVATYAGNDGVLEPMVVYRSCTNGNRWIRKLAEFVEQVPQGSGSVPRFSLESDAGGNKA